MRQHLFFCNSVEPPGGSAKVGSSDKSPRRFEQSNKPVVAMWVMVTGLALRHKPTRCEPPYQLLYVEVVTPVSKTIKSKARSHSKRVAYGTKLWG